MENQQEKIEVLRARKICKEFDNFKLSKNGLRDDAIEATIYEINEQLKPYHLDDSATNKFYLAFVSQRINESEMKTDKKRCTNCYFQHKKLDQIEKFLKNGDDSKAMELTSKMINCQDRLKIKWADLNNYNDCAKYVPIMPELGLNQEEAISDKITLIEFYETKTGNSFPVESSELREAADYGSH